MEGYYKIPTKEEIVDFNRVNSQRCSDAKAFNMPNPDPLFLAASLCEEAGEVAGAIKKLVRGYNRREFIKFKQMCLDKESKKQMQVPDGSRDWDLYALMEVWEWNDEFGLPAKHQTGYSGWHRYMMGKVAKEMADLYAYMDLACSFMGLELWEALQKKFNEVSTQMGCDQYQIHFDL